LSGVNTSAVRASVWRFVRRPAFVVCAGVLIASAATLNSVVSAMNLQLRKLPIEVDRQLHALPTETANWIRIAPDRVETAEMVKALGTTNYITRVFGRKDEDGRFGRNAPWLELHASFYTGTIDPVPHIPERCLVGGGWMQGTRTVNVDVPIDTTGWVEARDVPEVYRGRVMSAPFDRRYTDSGLTRIALPIGADRVRMRVTSFIEPNSDRSVFAGYFFVANHEAVTSAEDVRSKSFNLTTRYAYYTKVQFMTSSVSSEGELVTLAGELLSELWPELARCLPDWYGLDQDGGGSADR